MDRRTRENGTVGLLGGFQMVVQSSLLFTYLKGFFQKYTQVFSKFPEYTQIF
jgi:hypothetical protein